MNLSNEETQWLGLTQLQTDVIVTILELGGEASAPKIIETLSQKKKVNRTSIYSVLSKLEQIGIVESNDERSSNYALITTSPDILVEHLLEPQELVIRKFKKELKNAKSRQINSVEYEFYYLQNRDDVMSKMEIIIHDRLNYMLLMANETTLNNIYPKIEKIHHNNFPILVIPTWSPNSKSALGDVVKKYRELLGNQFVLDNLPIFDIVLPIMKSAISKYSIELQESATSSSFILLLTDNDWLMGTYLEEQPSTASGIFSREPLISQMIHILFLTIFENLSDSPPKNEIKTILHNKITTSMNMLNQLFDQHN